MYVTVLGPAARPDRITLATSMWRADLEQIFLVTANMRAARPKSAKINFQNSSQTKLNSN